MGKKAFIASLILILLLVGIQTVMEAKANFVPYPFTPNHDEPVLIVETPQNYTISDISYVLLNFTVIKPNSWNITGGLLQLPAIGEIDNITVSLNGNEKYLDPLPGDLLNGSGSWSKNYSIYIGTLDIGLNTLGITVNAYTYYVPQDYYEKSGVPVNHSTMNVTDTIFLNFSASTLSPNASPTLSPTLTARPIITPSPSPTQQPTMEVSPVNFVPTPSNLPILIIVALVAVMMTVSAVALFYLRRTKKQK